MVEEEAIITGKTEDFLRLHEPRSFPLSAEKNKALKKAWSRAKMNKLEGVTEGGDIFLSNASTAKATCPEIEGWPALVLL